MRLVLASALLLAATPAFAGEAHQFTRDGVTYAYSAAMKADGTVLLTGEDVTSHTPFALTIRNRQVSGTIGENPVDFRVSKVAAAQLAAETSDVQTAALAD